MAAFYFARTAEGQAAAYAATSAMPRKLRSLLKVIDGKTSNEVFASSLKAFGDVQGLLNSLKSAGLIELRATASESSPSAEVSAASSTTSFKSSAQVTRPDVFAPTQSAHTLSQTPAESGLSGQQQHDLQLLLQDMSSFVLAYVPAQAFSVLSELEQISNMEQMAVLLGGYELMVRDVGEPARIHMIHIRQILSKWL
jgi:hypothetical protein